MMQRVFEALASLPRRQILAHLAQGEMRAGDIASRFDMSKPSISQHLSILESAGLVTRQKRGQYVFYALAPDTLANTLKRFVQEVYPAARQIGRDRVVRDE